MPRLFHSSTLFVDALNASNGNSNLEPEAQPESPQIPCPEGSRFDYLFPPSDQERLNLGSETVESLTALGESMREVSSIDSTIPSAYTYFGQFVAHDLSLDPITKNVPLDQPLTPLPVGTIGSLINRRSGLLDLDNVYGPGLDEVTCYEIPRKNEEMRLATAYGSSVYGTDLPRGSNPPYIAKIGDSRNDENVTLSQLHAAFLRAHNIIVQNNKTYAQARKMLRNIYQHLVVKDLLPRIVHQTDIDSAKQAVDKGTAKYRKDHDFMPIEFTAAAFRFGHSMIRSKYTFNSQRGVVPLRMLFTPNALSDYYQLLADWVIDWRNFVDGGLNKARNFSPQLVEPLANLIDNTKNLNLSLAVRDLRRGYLLGLPTGQAFAAKMGKTAISGDKIEKVAVSDNQRLVLQTKGLSQQTPLWFYLFAESIVERDGLFLGPVCGQFVAEVLLEIARRSGYDEDVEFENIFGNKDQLNLTKFLLQTVPQSNP